MFCWSAGVGLAMRVYMNRFYVSDERPDMTIILRSNIYFFMIMNTHSKCNHKKVISNPMTKGLVVVKLTSDKGLIYLSYEVTLPALGSYLTTVSSELPIRYIT